MLCRRLLALSVLFLSCLVGTAKDKKKPPLPPDVLQAHTVLVVIDPDAGMDVQNPNANRLAQHDVENALMKWGRFSVVTDAAAADLIITVRKGSGKIVQPTIGGIPNNRPGELGPQGPGGRIGSRQGAPGDIGDPSDPQSDPQSSPSSPQPQMEVGLSHLCGVSRQQQRRSTGYSARLAPYRKRCASVSRRPGRRHVPETGRGYGETAGWQALTHVN